jgi:signal transduction histidine kinase/CheY-like chemotaxis protein
MSIKSKLIKTRISTKLLAIDALICIVFFMIVLMVFISFHHIRGLIRGVIVDEMNEVTTNALIERELSSILAETNLLLNTFFEDEAHLDTEGNRLLTLTLVLVGRTRGRDLEQPLQAFAQGFGFLLEQCKVVTATIRRRSTADRDIMAGIDRLEEILSEKRIDLALKGEDASIQEQLAVLVAGYRQSLLEIGKLHAESFPENYYTPLSAERDPLMAAVDDLILRFRTLKASEPQVAELGENLIDALRRYKELLLHLNGDMVALKARMNAVEDAKGQVAAVMEKLNRDVAQTIKAVNKKITRRFWITEIALLSISVSLVVALIVFTATFFKRIIKKPMDDIRAGIEAVRSGNLQARISLNRRDEWQLIENALNTMAAELFASYTALQTAHAELEVKVSERTLKLTQAKERAEAANLAKSVFLANMSHELRTPLNAILGYSQMMRRQISMPPEQREQLATINRSGEHLLALINDVLEISKIEAGKSKLNVTTVDMRSFLGDVAGMFASSCERKGLRFDLIGAEGVPPYLATDEDKLRRILINLLGNAVKFTEQGGIILRVAVRAQPLDRMRLTVEVADTGVGIAEADLDSVFAYFEQTASGLAKKSGTGLGLAISRDFARMMDGDITVTSTAGRGSTFRLAVAVEESRGTEIKADIRPRRIVGLETEAAQEIPRILVAEDNVESRLLLKKILQSVGFQVREAANGKEAVHIFKNWAPHFIWMDIRMPVMDGLEATRHIKGAAAGKSTRIAALTAHALAEEKEVILAAGCDDFVRKPYREEEIFEVMAAQLGIRYRYAEVGETPEADEPDVALRAEQLASLPEELFGQLYQSVVELDEERILALIDKIKAVDAHLAAVLDTCVRKLALSPLLNLLEKIEGPRPEKGGGP